MDRRRQLQQVIRDHSQDHNKAYNAYILERVSDDGLRDITGFAGWRVRLYKAI